MIFPEFLYRLSARDQQVTWLDPFIRFATDSQAAATVTADVTVDTDRALVLTHAMVYCDPGAGQFINFQQLDLLPPDSTVRFPLIRDDTDRAADLIFALSWQGELIVPPGWTISARGTFNAAVAANYTECDVAGILIPVANIQRV